MRDMAQSVGWPMTYTPGWTCAQGFQSSYYTIPGTIAEASRLQIFMSFMFGLQGYMPFAWWDYTESQSGPLVHAIQRAGQQGAELSRQAYDVDRSGNNNDLELSIDAVRPMQPGGLTPAQVVARESQDSHGCVLVRVVNLERAPAMYTLHSDRLARLQAPMP